MASNINLSTARVVTAAINQTLNNGYFYNAAGAVQALRSPQLSGLIREMTPVKPNGQISVAANTLNPQVTLNYRPAFTPTVRTARTVEAGATPTAASTTTVTYNLRREFTMNFRTQDFPALEQEAQNYLRSIASGVNLPVPSDKLGLIGSEFARQFNGGLLAPVQSQCITALNAAAGTSRNFPGVLAGVSQTIDLFGTNGEIKKDFWVEMNRLKRLHNIAGKPIVIGGELMAQYLEAQKIAAMTSLGYDWEQLYATLPVEFYYDDSIDSALGAGEILVIDPGAACLQTIAEHEYLVNAGKHALTTFDTTSFQVASVNAPTFAMDFDVRVREDDTTGYPVWMVTPSILFGIFTRPAGFRTTDASWTGVTGIFKYVLTA